MHRVLNRKLTYEDYAAAPADGSIYQVIDGDVLVTPSPNPVHQRTSKRLQRQLEAYFEARGLGEVFNAPIDLILSPHDILQPDLAVVTDRSTISRRGIEAPPALVVEVLSPASERHDRGLKARRYAQLGVRHYWIVDPDARRITCFELRGETYAEVAAAEAPGTIESGTWPGLRVDLGAIWSA